MGRVTTTARREADLVRRCYAGLDGAALQAEVLRSIHGLLPLDAVFIATADPMTLLFTGAVAEEPLDAATAQFLDNEFGRVDVNKFQALAVGPRRVSTLDQATRGQRADSARYRDIMAPLGFGDELRAALVTPAGCWGYLCLHRADSPRGFTDAETRLISRLTAHLGNGLRHSLRLRMPGAAAGPALAGVIILHPDLTVAAVTGEAERWLALMPGRPVAPGRLPAAVYTVAAQLRSIEQGLAAPDASPTVCVPSIAGGWLFIHASRLNPSVGDIAVIIEPTQPNQVAPLLLGARGLTPRERDVALLVLRGTSTQAISAQLHLSPYTVKDHLKSIFDKMGVRSRRDLVANMLTGE
jgi:DNA-binding CsgD family transcriptional regulator